MFGHGKSYMVKGMENKMDIKQIIRKIDTWSLYYRTEIIWFAVGFIIGIII